MMLRKEIINDLKVKIKDIPISTIIESRIEVLGKDAICPFHDDQHLGSFKWDDRKGIFKCFSCGATGDAIKFISMYDGISYTMAVFTIALEYGLITKDQYREYTKKEADHVTTRSFVSVDKRESRLAPVADENTLNLVYSLYSNGLKLLGEEDKLTNEHRDYLHNRGFNDEEIERLGAFSIPGRGMIKILKKHLKRHGITSLCGIPGFYRNIKTHAEGCIKAEGIGLPVRNAKGNIVAIQVRRDTVKKGESRYFWLSSSFVDKAENDGKLEGGCSPSSPVAVVLPKDLMSDEIVITEGIFKAIKIADKKNCIALSVQGVGNFAGIDEMISSIRSRYGLKGNIVDIGYDADMAMNVEVFKNLMKLSSVLVKTLGCKVQIMVWDHHLGKGLDDLILNKKEDTIRYIDVYEFRKRYLDIVERLKNTFTDKETFIKDFETSYIEKFCR